ncbi:MAG: hypothetical protein AB201_01605 [Parcubacteria bacterium C7867-006]|nr:MAG: hypothetical protein AB201_01605 [Parcubacteria bacterium C7867-006]
MVQDVIPPKKSIRNVKLPSRSAGLDIAPRRTAPKINREEAPKPEPMLEDFSRPVSIKTEVSAPVRVEAPVGNNKPPIINSSYKYEFDEPKKPSKKILYTSVFVLVILGAFGISAFFKSAKITITPKNISIPLNDSFTAKKDISSGGLGFQVVTVVKEVEKSVEATGEARVDKKARGTITIYNTYSSQSQKLVATTRFETPEGLIYRLVSPVTVPGTSVKSGKTVAGSVDAVVEADKTGAEYNISYKDFTIPGFKGDPKYTKVYARSKTEMTGGFSGMQKIVSEAIINQTNTELEKTLKETLAKDITAQIPADYVLFSSSLTYKLEAITQTNSSTGGAVLKKKGVASAVIFDKGVLSRTLLAKLSPDSTNDVVKITNLDSLNFEYATQSPVDINTANSITFSLKGVPQFVWVVDENKIKSELLGLSKKEAKNIVSKYPTIKETWIETQPFWNQTVPTDTNKVTLINTLTK